MFFIDFLATDAKANNVPHIFRLFPHEKSFQYLQDGEHSGYMATIAATTPRKSAATENTTVVAPPVKGAAEEDEPEPDGEAAPDAVPVGGEVVEAVG